jgi:hypothetical protein
VRKERPRIGHDPLPDLQIFEGVVGFVWKHLARQRRFARLALPGQCEHRETLGQLAEHTGSMTEDRLYKLNIRSSDCTNYRIHLLAHSPPAIVSMRPLGEQDLLAQGDAALFGLGPLNPLTTWMGRHLGCLGSRACHVEPVCRATT